MAEKIKFALFFLKEIPLGETEARIWLDSAGLLNDKTEEMIKGENKEELISILQNKLKQKVIH